MAGFSVSALDGFLMSLDNVTGLPYRDSAVSAGGSVSAIIWAKNGSFAVAPPPAVTAQISQIF